MTPVTAGAPHESARREARLGLYVHVPFCATRCTYCDFSSGRLSAAAVERYLGGMEREIERRAPAAAGLRFTSVFFGGGTPSALGTRHFRRLWSALSARFEIAPQAEISLEANPESVRPALLDAWALAGVNRLSMGAQSFHADELESLGRIHPATRPAEALALARAHGFRRLSLDLMFGFPGHDLARWAETLSHALALDPGHLSAYCFIPESGTPLGDAVLGGRVALPEADEQAAMYEALTQAVERRGYACYETSNFCRPGEEARHNLVYWLRRPYVALGPSAHGFVAGERYGNHYALGRWAAALERDEAPEAERESETAQSIAEEILMLGLRLADGIGAADLTAVDWRRFERRYGRAIEWGLATGRLERAAGRLRIPAPHRFVADDVIASIAAVDEPAAVDTTSIRSIPLASCPNPLSPAA